MEEAVEGLQGCELPMVLHSYWPSWLIEPVDSVCFQYHSRKRSTALVPSSSQLETPFLHACVHVLAHNALHSTSYTHTETSSINIPQLSKSVWVLHGIAYRISVRPFLPNL